MGAFQGAFTAIKATELGSTAIRAALKEANLKGDQVGEVIMGCVLPAGLGQAPARQASIHAGIANSVPCTTVNKVCGSAMKAVMLAHDLVKLGSQQIVVAGGMESMTNAPYLLDRARGGYRLGHGKILDHMFYDGLEDAYHPGRLMGSFAEDTAEHFKFSRQDQDAFATESSRRAQQAMEQGYFAHEIAPVVVRSRGQEETISEDETPKKVKIEKIPTLKPAFREGGTVTAANSSSIADGAAALVLMSRVQAEKLGLKPLAVIRGHAMHAQAPEWYTTAPIGAVEKLCEQVGWKINDVDLFEINEAFAVVTMAAMQKLKITHDRVNIWGGACALGHPIGASGARLIVTLLHALAHQGVKRGIATLCIGGGEATAVAVERV
jgi:acetyl-CoA C-acetyltransferase